MIDFSDDYLIVKDRALILKLRSLGAGVEEGDQTKITYLEAAYFADRGVLPAKKEELLKHVKEEHAKEKYAVIKYLRDRGYIVRPSLDGTGYLPHRQPAGPVRTRLVADGNDRVGNRFGDSDSSGHSARGYPRPICGRPCGPLEPTQGDDRGRRFHRDGDSLAGLFGLERQP